MNKNFFNNIVFVFLSVMTLAIAFSSCEREFDPQIKYTPLITVEAYIEGGERSTPPYVVLTRSLDFFSKLNPADFEKTLVRGAKVTVSDGTVTDTLTEICLNDLTPQQKLLAGQFLGINVDSLDGVNASVCIYTSLSFKLLGKEGKTYNLRIEADGQVLTASTTIPKRVPLDSLVIRKLPDLSNDTLRQLRGFLTDPSSEKNYYRSQVSINDGPYRARSNSVVNDNFFDGKPSFEFPISRPFLPNQENFDFETASLYKVGEKVSVRFLCIDDQHFKFWETAEANVQNIGPFATYTRVTSNINGGLGIFGGFSASYYDKIIK